MGAPPRVHVFVSVRVAAHGYTNFSTGRTRDSGEGRTGTHRIPSIASGGSRLRTVQNGDSARGASPSVEADLELAGT